MKRLSELLNLTVVILVLIVVTYLALRNDRAFGPVVFGLGLVPFVWICALRLGIRRLIPDLLFGALDTGLLVIGALVGAKAFGVLGAIFGSVVGDAVTDGIAGYLEGGVSEWLRRHGIDESRTAMGSALGKMSGCLFASGFVLSIYNGIELLV